MSIFSGDKNIYPSVVSVPTVYETPTVYDTGAGGGVEIGGVKYTTVKINGVEWLAENLDYKWDGLSIGDASVSQDVPQACYYNNNENLFGQNNKKYGLLYNWPAILQIDQLIDGWHVPTQAELQSLYNALSPDFLKHIQSCYDYSLASTFGLGVGFNMPPSGIFSGSFSGYGSGFYIGSKTQFSAAYMYTLESSGMDNEGKNRRVSVRLIKD